MKQTSKGKRPTGPNIFGILTPYRPIITVLATLSIVSNVLTLWLPKIISHAIDAFAHHSLVVNEVALRFGLISGAIFILTYCQSIMQSFASERVAKDMRNSLAAKISRQSHAYIQSMSSSRLLTNLTSDMDSVKMFVSQAITSLISSLFLIVGASVLLLLTNWRLALVVLLVVPVIGMTFFFTLQKVRALFLSSREVIDRLNRVINESILGSALIRVFDSQGIEYTKFLSTNSDSQEIGVSIVRVFAGLIPTIGFVANMATLAILALGGHFVINGVMSLGDFAAFSTYLAILIFPIIVVGFVSNIIAQANASYSRIAEVLNAPEVEEKGTITARLKGEITAKDITVEYGEKMAVKNVSFTVKPGTRTAIVGPTAAGKTQLLYVLTGLLEPQSGTVLFDGHDIHQYDKKALHNQTGFVFQDSIVFNLSVRENIAFSTMVSDEDLDKAIATAELQDLIEALPDKLDSIVSERGATLSGGQKQRLMLARALALNPKILLLDDFTARVDTVTEAKILANLRTNYPNLTLISVTQKVEAVEHYDQILLLMEGELLAQGTHKQLLKSSPEYMQIYTSQQSTNTYELRAQ
jgi:ATP-binding cassette subfamily B protein